MKEFRSIHDTIIEKYYNGDDYKKYITLLLNRYQNNSTKRFLIKLIEDQLDNDNLDPIIFSKRKLNRIFKTFISMGFYMEEISNRYVAIFIDEYPMDERLALREVNRMLNTSLSPEDKFRTRINYSVNDFMQLLNVYKIVLKLIRLYYSINKFDAIKIFGNRNAKDISIFCEDNKRFYYTKDLYLDCVNLRNRLEEVKKKKEEERKQKEKIQEENKRIREKLRGFTDYKNEAILPHDLELFLSKYHCKTCLENDLSEVGYYTITLSGKGNNIYKSFVEQADLYYKQNKIIPRVKEKPFKKTLYIMTSYLPKEDKARIFKIIGVRIEKFVYVKDTFHSITFKILLGDHY